jgi:hypothetical protein
MGVAPAHIHLSKSVYRPRAFPLRNRNTSSLMPPKPVAELTQVEVGFLATAARLFAVIRSVQDNPPPPALQVHYNAKIKEEMVSQFHTYSISCKLTIAFTDRHKYSVYQLC